MVQIYNTRGILCCRRSAQLTQCGFHGPPSCPYRDVGEVELDDRRLIQEGLGQTSLGKEGQQQVRKTESNTVIHYLFSQFLYFDSMRV